MTSRCQKVGNKAKNISQYKNNSLNRFGYNNSSSQRLKKFPLSWYRCFFQLLYCYISEYFHEFKSLNEKSCQKILHKNKSLWSHNGLSFTMSLYQSLFGLVLIFEKYNTDLLILWHINDLMDNLMPKLFWG